MKKVIILFVIIPMLALAAELSGHPVFNDQDKRISIAHNIVASLAKEDFDGVKAAFDPNLDKQLSADQLGQGWHSVTSQLGPYKSILSTETTVVQNFNQVRVKCKFENGASVVEVTFSAEDKVIGLWLKPVTQ